jgi:predicted helicase
MANFIEEQNYAIATTRLLSTERFFHAFITTVITDMCLLSTKTKETTYIFPLYLYSEEPMRIIGELALHDESNTKRISNFTSEFLEALKESLGSEPASEEIFHYIYAVLYSPTYRKRYQEFLKIDFPRIPLPSDYDVFKELSNLGKELVDLHLLKHPDLEKTQVGFPKGNSNKVEKVSYDEDKRRVFINKDQYFEGISKDIWEYRIGAYQVMEKYLKDRKGRILSLDEVNHYMKVGMTIRLTIKLQERIDEVYRKIEV